MLTNVTISYYIYIFIKDKIKRHASYKVRYNNYPHWGFTIEFTYNNLYIVEFRTKIQVTTIDISL